MGKCGFCKHSYPSSNMNGNNPNGWQCELYYLDDRQKYCEAAIEKMCGYNRNRSCQDRSSKNESNMVRREKIKIQLDFTDRELSRDFFQQFDKVLRLFEIHFQNGKPFIYFDRVQNMFDFEERLQIFSEYNDGSNVGYYGMSIFTGINGNPTLIIECKRV